MINFIAILIISLLTNFQGKNPNDWEPIFNGKNIEGWIVKAKPEDVAKGDWFVKENMIVANSLGDSIHDYIWLLTEKEYSDFELKFRFKVCRSNKGNSGLQIRSRYDDSAFWLDGPQIDINPTDPFRCGMIWDETREVNHWIYPWIDKGKGWVTPEMAINPVEIYYCDDKHQWNEMFVVVKSYHITCYLNSIKVTDFEGESILNDNIHKKYQVDTKGHLALQIHIKDQLEIYYKDLFVKELN